ncbi:WD40-repeat-containing domain protein [Lipomyces arxii]|uniref:WD40-repeat-containing domain protein n=1 Tax=Lipomyces arxii TaxID=56418 RepID=UPI0034CED402
MDSLPAELILKITKYFTLFDLLAFKSVCQRWYSISQDPLIWQTLYFQKGWPYNEHHVDRINRYLYQRALRTKYNINGDFMTEHTTTPGNFDQNEIWASSLNWHYIYQIRHHLEQNWTKGKFWMTCIPSVSSSSSSGTTSISSVASHTASVYAVRFNNKLLLSASRDSTVKVWDLDTRLLLATLRGHRGSVLCLQFDQASNFVVSGGADGRLIIWDLEQREQVRSIQAHSDSVMDVAISDEYIVSCSRDRKVCLWDRNAPFSLIRTLEGHIGVVNSVKIKGRHVVSGSGDRSIRFWDIDTGQCIRTIVRHSRGISTIGFDGKTIVSGSSDRTIAFFDTKTGEMTELNNVHDSLVRTLHYTPARMVTGSYDGTVKCWVPVPSLYQTESAVQWTLQFAIPVPRYFGPTVQVFDLQFDHRRIIVSSLESTILYYDMGKDIDGLDALDEIFHTKT